MAIVTNRNQFGIDPNASSPQRIRRNFQRLAAAGAGGTSFTASSPLNLSSGVLSLNLNSSGGLSSNIGGLFVLCAPNGGIEDTAAGILEYGFRSAASTPLVNDGDTYYDTTYTAPFFQEVGIPMAIGGKVYQAGGNSNTVTNASSGTFTLPNGNFAFPPNFFTLGKSIQVQINISVTAPIGTAAAFQFQFNGVTYAQPVNYTPAGNSISTARAYVSIILTCRQVGTATSPVTGIGTGGTLGRVGLGILETQNGVGGSSIQAPGGGVVDGFDTTITETITLGCTFSATSGVAMFVSEMIVTVLN